MRFCKVYLALHILTIQCADAFWWSLTENEGMTSEKQLEMMSSQTAAPCTHKYSHSKAIGFSCQQAFEF